MKKIVILSAFLSPLRSGAEACAEEVPLALADQFDFTIVTARMRRDLPKYDKLHGKIPVMRVGFGYTFDKWLYPFLAPLAVRKMKPDVCHAVLETFAGLALVFCNVPKKILTCQTTNRSFLKGFIVRSADQVTAISDALINIVQPYRKDVVTKIPNGIHVHEFADARKKHKKVAGRILFVGRLEKQKGVDLLIEAFLTVQKKHACRLYIVGSGSLAASLKKRYASEQHITFDGALTGPLLLQKYAQSEIFCGLSRSEALGNVFLEAQAAGCAVVGTTVGGIPDTVTHNKTGLLVEPENVSAAAEALEKLLTDPTLRAELGASGIENASQYDWGDIATEYAKLY